MVPVLRYPCTEITITREDTTMANPPLPTHIFVGAARSRSETRGGVFRQAIGDDRWEHLTKGLPVVTDVQAITVHPGSPEVIYLGTRSGPYRSTDRGERWERLGFPDDTEVLSILVHPTNPRTLYAGTSPVGVYRSDDGGDTWRRLPKATQPERVKMKSFVCRVMRLAADPPRAARTDRSTAAETSARPGRASTTASRPRAR